MRRSEQRPDAFGRVLRLVIADYEAGLRQELQKLYSKDAAGKATDEDLRRCDEIAYELREAESCLRG